MQCYFDNLNYLLTLRDQSTEIINNLEEYTKAIRHSSDELFNQDNQEEEKKIDDTEIFASKPFMSKNPKFVHDFADMKTHPKVSKKMDDDFYELV